MIQRKVRLPRARRSRGGSVERAALDGSLERQKCSIRKVWFQEKAFFLPEYKYGLGVPEPSSIKD